MNTSDPGLTIGIALITIVIGLTSLGIYISFGPPGKNLEDPIDHHDD